MEKLPKTKIVATIGPSSWDDKVLREMITNGMQIARINASFADFKELERVSLLLRKISPRITLMLDTKGHKIRVTGFEQDKKLNRGEEVILVSESNPLKNDKYIGVTYPTLAHDVTRGVKILLDDGNLTLLVKDIHDEEVLCEVVAGGILKKRKTVNIPGVHLNFPTLSKKDSDDIKFAVAHEFDYISASFVRNTEDVEIIRQTMGNTNTKLIAKIEDYEAVQNFDAILALVDGIMVARGDLGVELPAEKVPVLQKQFILKCRMAGKPVIVATQMLESMRDNIRPTRAEVSDVANAVMDGTDAVMLSAETSTGKYPVEAVKMMKQIALETENILRPQIVDTLTSASLETDVLCKHLCTIANEVNLAGIIVLSKTGKTVASLARHRPNIPVWSISPDPKLIRQQNMFRGVSSFYIQNFDSDRDSTIRKAVEIVYGQGDLEMTDKIAIISGSSITNKKTNSILEIVNVKDVL